jgi:hypothetical protein
MTEPTLDERIAKLRKMPYDADRHDAADAIIDEQQREIERLKEELNWYQTEAVARTNTDARTKP